jgi:hypothetical protein
MSGYLTAWVVIAVTAIGGTVALYFLTRSMKPSLFRLLLRVLPGVLMVVPAPVPGYPNVAPAFVVLVFEALFQAEGKPMPALIILAATLVAAVLAAVLASRMTAPRQAPESFAGTD